MRRRVQPAASRAGAGRQSPSHVEGAIGTVVRGALRRVRSFVVQRSVCRSSSYHGRDHVLTAAEQPSTTLDIVGIAVRLGERVSNGDASFWSVAVVSSLRGEPGSAG